LQHICTTDLYIFLLKIYSFFSWEYVYVSLGSILGTPIFNALKIHSLFILGECGIPFWLSRRLNNSLKISIIGTMLTCLFMRFLGVVTLQVVWKTQEIKQQGVSLTRHEKYCTNQTSIRMKSIVQIKPLFVGTNP